MKVKTVLTIVGVLIGGIFLVVQKMKYTSWEEDVRLVDGRVIVVEQKRKYFDKYGTDQSWLTIDIPELGGQQVWHSYLIPMRLDVLDGAVYVLGRPRGPKQVAYYRYPKVCIVAFKWNGAEFQRVPLVSVPQRFLQEENVFSCVPQPRRSKVSLQEKDAAWCPPAGDKGQFRRVIDLPAYRKACDVMASLDRAQNRSD